MERAKNPCHILTTRQLLLVLAVCFAVSLLSISHVLVGAFRTPPGYFYLWTGHYYTDYFAYVQAMSQGARGRWLVENPYTTEEEPATFLAWGPDLLLGKAGGFFGLSPFLSYWLAIAVFAFILAFVTFWTIHRLLADKPFSFQFFAFLLTLFVAPFLGAKGNILEPFDSWYLPVHFFKRYGSIPRRFLDQILGIVVLLTSANLLERSGDKSLGKNLVKAVIAGFVLSFLLTFSFVPINLAASVFLTGLFLLIKAWRENKEKFFRILLFLGVIGMILLPAALWIRHCSFLSPSLQRCGAWDFSQQVKLSPSQIFLLLGPAVFFIPLGIIRYFRGNSVLKTLVAFYFFWAVVFFFSPLSLFLKTTNARFLDSLIYLPLGVWAAEGLENKRRLVFGILVALLVFLLIPANVFFFKERQSDSGLLTLSNLPFEFLEGFSFLEKEKETGVVLTTPWSDLGLLTPVFTSRKVFVGHSLLTARFSEKRTISALFFTGSMTEGEAKNFLAENDIGFVVTGIRDRNSGRLDEYSFLNPVFKNNQIVIYTP